MGLEDRAWPTIPEDLEKKYGSNDANETADRGTTKRNISRGKSTTPRKKQYKSKHRTKIGIRITALLGAGLITILAGSTIKNNIEANIQKTAQIAQRGQMLYTKDGVKSEEVYNRLVENGNIIPEMEEAIPKYMALKDKKDLTASEMIEFANACQIIGNSRLEVADFSETTIEGIVASLYDVKSTSDISIKDYIIKEGPAHDPTVIIETKDSEKIILSRNFFDKKMPKEWADLIIDYKALRDQDPYQDSVSTKEYDFQSIITTYGKTIALEQNKGQYELGKDGKSVIKHKEKEDEER